MRVRTIGVAIGVGLAVYASAAMSACTGDDPSVGPSTGDDGSAEGSSGGGLKAGGAACAQGAECTTGNCADGVCCDTACSGVCESCNQGGSTGKCLPIAAGTDPDGECKPLALPLDDGGADAGGDGGDGGTLNLPDGGVSGTETPCAGACDGNRACAFPGASTTCGTRFCNDTTTLGRLACNGGGHCADLTFDACQGYVCKDGASSACGKTCAAEDDCDDAHYCDGLSSTCKPKKGLGIACTVAGECTSGNCVGGPPGVCCNSVCNFSGATCATGTCKCSACADPTGTCLLFYRDSDGDTYGDLNVTTIGCDKSPPSGYVLDHTDCDDTNPAIHPGAGFSPNKIVGGPKDGTFDYDCDGKETKATPDNLGSTTCGYCGSVNVGGAITCERASTTCTVAGRAGTLNCGYLACGLMACCSGYGSGFPGTVACGTSSTLYACLGCAAAGDGSGVTTTPNVTQYCK